MANLRSSLIRLAHTNPEIRPEILSLLKEASDDSAGAAKKFVQGLQKSLAKSMKTPESKLKVVDKKGVSVLSGSFEGKKFSVLVDPEGSSLNFAGTVDGMLVLSGHAPFDSFEKNIAEVVSEVIKSIGKDRSSEIGKDAANKVPYIIGAQVRDTSTGFYGIVEQGTPAPEKNEKDWTRSVPFKVPATARKSLVRWQEGPKKGTTTWAPWTSIKAVKNAAKAPAKLTGKKLDAAISKAYYKHFNGVQINIMDTVKISRLGRAAYEGGATPEEAEKALDEAMKDAVPKFRQN